MLQLQRGFHEGGGGARSSQACRRPVCSWGLTSHCSDAARRILTSSGSTSLCPSTARSTNHTGDSNSLVSVFKIQPAIEVSLWTVKEAPAQAAGLCASLPWAESLFLWWLFILFSTVAMLDMYFSLEKPKRHCY